MYGALAAFILIIGLPLAMLSMPAGGMFLLLVPVWMIVTSLAAYLVYRRFGQRGVVILTITVILSPVMGSLFRNQHPRPSNFAPGCGPVSNPIRPFDTRPDIILFSNVELFAPMRDEAFDPLEMIAVLTGAEVIEGAVLPEGFRRKSIKPSRGGECTGKQSRREISTMGGTVRKIDTCLTVTDVTKAAEGADYYRGRSLVRFFADSQNDRKHGLACNSVRVSLPTGQPTLFQYERARQSLRPDPALSKSGSYGDDWLLAVVSVMLKTDISEAALARHLTD